MLSDIVDENENDVKECIDDDVHDVEVDAKAVLQFFYIFYDRAIILLFTRNCHNIRKQFGILKIRTHNLSLSKFYINHYTIHFLVINIKLIILHIEDNIFSS